MITFALAKGRLATDTAALLEQSGMDCSVLKENTRKLILQSADGQFRFIMVKPTDVPVYVDAGVADIGVVGKDTLMEANLPLFELLDLGFSRCRMCVCGFPPENTPIRPLMQNRLRVATKYQNIARSWYGRKGESIDIIPLSGSVELGPLVGLSDVIVDIVESGSTLKANGLVVLEEILPVSARLVVNQASLKLKNQFIRPWVEKLSDTLHRNNNCQQL